MAPCGWSQGVAASSWRRPGAVARVQLRSVVPGACVVRCPGWPGSRAARRPRPRRCIPALGQGAERAADGDVGGSPGPPGHHRGVRHQQRGDHRIGVLPPPAAPVPFRKQHQPQPGPGTRRPGSPRPAGTRPRGRRVDHREHPHRVLPGRPRWPTAPASRIWRALVGHDDQPSAPTIPLAGPAEAACRGLPGWPHGSGSVVVLGQVRIIIGGSPFRPGAAQEPVLAPIACCSKARLPGPVRRRAIISSAGRRPGRAGPGRVSGLAVGGPEVLDRVEDHPGQLHLAMAGETAADRRSARRAGSRS